MVQDSAVNVERLQKIIDETQGTIRAFDAKASALASLLALSVSVLNFGFLAHAPGTVAMMQASVVVKWLVGVSSMLGLGAACVAGFVLVPLSNPWLPNSQTIKAEGTYYVIEDKIIQGLDSFYDDIKSTDWEQELCIQVLKTARIRNVKAARFNRAMLGALITFGLIAITISVSILSLQ